MIGGQSPRLTARDERAADSVAQIMVARPGDDPGEDKRVLAIRSSAETDNLAHTSSPSMTWG